jgi:hypothetical protein
MTDRRRLIGYFLPIAARRPIAAGGLRHAVVVETGCAARSRVPAFPRSRVPAFPLALRASTGEGYHEASPEGFRVRGSGFRVQGSEFCVRRGNRRVGSVAERRSHQPAISGAFTPRFPQNGAPCTISLSPFAPRKRRSGSFSLRPSLRRQTEWFPCAPFLFTFPSALPRVPRAPFLRSRFPVQLSKVNDGQISVRHACRPRRN